MDIIDNIIIGGGAAGLTLAHQFQQKGSSFLLLEKEDRVGGVVKTERVGAYTFESGPHTLLPNSERIWSFITQELALKDKILPAQSATKRYILNQGKLVELPASPGKFLTSPLFSLSSKAKVLSGLFAQRRREGSEDESLAHLVRRHVGQELLDKAVNPFIAGSWAGDPEQLSADCTMPLLAELERDYGSLVGGMIKRKKKLGNPTYPRRILSFDGGLQTLIDALAQPCQECIHLNTELKRLAQQDHGWLVEYTYQGQTHTVLAQRLLVTVPIHAWTQLPWGDNIRTRFNQLPEVGYSPVWEGNLVFPRDAVKHTLDGFGYLTPQIEHAKVLGALFTSSLFPGRVPSDCCSLGVFVGGVRDAYLVDASEGDIEQVALEELAKHLGVRGSPVFTAWKRWEQSIPQYHVGYNHFLEALSQLEHEFQGLHCLGNFRGGIALPAVIESSLRFAETCH